MSRVDFIKFVKNKLLGNVTDVEIVTPQDNEVLTYRDGIWKNKNPHSIVWSNNLEMALDNNLCPVLFEE